VILFSLHSPLTTRRDPMGRGIWIHASNHRLVRVIYRQPWMSIAAVTRDHPASLTGPGLRGREAAIDRRSRE
jgi:hypothetical protein